MPNDNNCPQPGCGLPESTHRYKGGKRISICGNAHSWNPDEVKAQRERAHEAQQSEVNLKELKREVEALTFDMWGAKGRPQQ